MRRRRVARCHCQGEHVLAKPGQAAVCAGWGERCRFRTACRVLGARDCSGKRRLRAGEDRSAVLASMCCPPQQVRADGGRRIRRRRSRAMLCADGSLALSCRCGPACFRVLRHVRQAARWCNGVRGSASDRCWQASIFRQEGCRHARTNERASGFALRCGWIGVAHGDVARRGSMPTLQAGRLRASPAKAESRDEGGGSFGSRTRSLCRRVLGGGEACVRIRQR